MKTMAIACALATASFAQAAFTPIQLTPESFNADIIVEQTAPPPVATVTTASMSAGPLNIGFAWFERGYLPEWASVGLPGPGAILTSDSKPDHQYQFAPDYRANNAILLDSNLITATFTLTQPAPCAALSFLTASAGGNAIINCVVRHADGSTEPGALPSPDWFSLADRAWAANGRVEVSSFGIDSLNSDFPRLFDRELPLTNTTSPVIQIDLAYAGSPAHTTVLAVSAATNSTDGFSPVPVTGYNADIIVEATAARPGWLAGVTTASMENGNANTKCTWYEQGYVPGAPATGLPAPGAEFNSQAAPQHRYALAPCYKENNAVLLDADNPSAAITPAMAANWAALSFLTASANGPVTLGCVVNHADGTAETNSVTAPDWFEAGPAAINAGGRIDLNTRRADSMNGGPRLFDAELAVTQTSSPVTNIALTIIAGAANAHAAVLAVSGASESFAVPILSIAAGENGALVISSTAPGELQSTEAFQGASTSWQTEGPISRTVSVQPVAAGRGKFYRVVVHP